MITTEALIKFAPIIAGNIGCNVIEIEINGESLLFTYSFSEENMRKYFIDNEWVYLERVKIVMN